MSGSEYKVYVGGIEGLEQDDLRDAFQQFGSIERIWVARNPPGFGFIYFRDHSSAEDAVNSMNEREINGKTIRVELPRPDKREKNFESKSRSDNRNNRSSDRPSYRVRITNVPSSVTWRELRDFVRPVAEASYANVRDDEGVVEFTSEDDMLKVIRELDNTSLDGNTVQISQTTGGKSFNRSNNSSRDYSRGSSSGYNNSREGYGNSRNNGYKNSREGYNNSRTNTFSRRRSRSRSSSPTNDKSSYRRY